MPIQRRWGFGGLLVGMLILSSCGGNAAPPSVVEAVPNTEIPVNAELVEATPDAGFLLTKGHTIGGEGLENVTWSPDGTILRTYTGMLDENGQTEGAPLAFSDWNVQTGEQVGLLSTGVTDLFYGRDAAWSHTASQPTMITLNQTVESSPYFTHRSLIHVHVSGPDGSPKVTWPAGYVASYENNPQKLLALNPTGDTFATTTHLTTTIWTLDGQSIAEMPVTEGENRSVAWSPDGKWLAIGDTKGIVAMWDAETKRREQLIYAHPFEITSLTWSHDSRTLISAGDGLVRFWEPATATELYPAFPNPNHHTISMVVGNPQHPVVAILTNEDIVMLWNLDTSRIIQTLSVDNARSIAWNPDGDTLAISRGTHSIELWHRQ